MGNQKKLLCFLGSRVRKAAAVTRFAPQVAQAVRVAVGTTATTSALSFSGLDWPATFLQACLHPSRWIIRRV